MGAPPPPAAAPGMSAGPGAWALRGLFVIGLVLLLREARVLLAPVLIAVVLTFVLAPAVRALKRRLRVPEYIGAAALVGALLLSVAPLAASLAEPAAQWWERAPQTLAQLFEKFDRIRAAVPGLAPPPPQPAAPPPAPTARGSRAAAQTPPPPAAPPPDPVKERIASEGVALTGALLGKSAALAISATATVILLYFLLASEHWMLSRVVEAVPRRRTRALVLGGVRAAQREIGRYLFALAVINAAVGVVTGVALWALELPNPTLWGAIVGVLNFIPYIGPMIIVGMLTLAGVTTFEALPAMLAPGLAFLAIHAVESNVISPFVVGRRLALSPISVFLSVMFWGWLWGIAGALIAVPILIGIRSSCRRSRRLKLLCRFLDGDAKPPPPLHALLARRPRVGLRGAVPWRAGAASAAPVASEAVHVAHARGVDVLANPAREPEAVARPLEHDA